MFEVPPSSDQRSHLKAQGNGINNNEWRRVELGQRLLKRSREGAGGPEGPGVQGEGAGGQGEGTRGLSEGPGVQGRGLRFRRRGLGWRGPGVQGMGLGLGEGGPLPLTRNVSPDFMFDPPCRLTPWTGVHF